MRFHLFIIEQDGGLILPIAHSLPIAESLFHDVMFFLKILSYCELKLVDENLLESIEIVLLVKYKHGLLVVDRVDRAEAQRTIAVGNKNSIAGDEYVFEYRAIIK